MATSVGEIFLKIGADDTDFSRKLRRIETRMLKMASNMDRIRNQAAVAFAGASAAMGGAVIAAAKLERGVADAAAVASKGGANYEKVFKKMEKRTLELAGATEFTSTQVAGAFKFMSMAGVELQEQLSGIDDVMRLASAAGIDVAKSADLVTNIMAGMGKEAKDLQDVNNTLVGTFTAANTSLEQLGQAFKQIGPVANSLGISIEDVSAAIGSLGNSGIQGEQAGTGLKVVLGRVSTASGKARNAMNTLGVSMENIADQTDGIGFSNLVSALENARKRMSTVDFDKAIATAFGQRGKNIAAILSQAGVEGVEGLRKAIDRAQKIDLTKILEEKKLQTFQGQLNILASAFENLAVAIGKELIPALRPVITFATDAFASFNKLPSVLRKTAAYTILGTVALSGLTIAFTMLGGAIARAVTALAAFGAEGAVMGGVSAASTSLASETAALSKSYTVLGNQVGKTFGIMARGMGAVLALSGAFIAAFGATAGAVGIVRSAMFQSNEVMREWKSLFEFSQEEGLFKTFMGLLKTHYLNFLTLISDNPISDAVLRSMTGVKINAAVLSPDQKESFSVSQREANLNIINKAEAERNALLKKRFALAKEISALSLKLEAGSGVTRRLGSIQLSPERLQQSESLNAAKKSLSSLTTDIEKLDQAISTAASNVKNADKIIAARKAAEDEEKARKKAEAAALRAAEALRKYKATISDLQRVSEGWRKDLASFDLESSARAIFQVNEELSRFKGKLNTGLGKELAQRGELLARKNLETADSLKDLRQSALQLENTLRLVGKDGLSDADKATISSREIAFLDKKFRESSTIIGDAGRKLADELLERKKELEKGELSGSSEAERQLKAFDATSVDALAALSPEEQIAAIDRLGATLDTALSDAIGRGDFSTAAQLGKLQVREATFAIDNISGGFRGLFEGFDDILNLRIGDGANKIFDSLSQLASGIESVGDGLIKALKTFSNIANSLGDSGVLGSKIADSLSGLFSKASEKLSSAVSGGGESLVGTLLSSLLGSGGILGSITSALGIGGTSTAATAGAGGAGAAAGGAGIASVVGSLASVAAAAWPVAIALAGVAAAVATVTAWLGAVGVTAKFAAENLSKAAEGALHMLDTLTSDAIPSSLSSSGNQLMEFFKTAAMSAAPLILGLGAAAVSLTIFTVGLVALGPLLAIMGSALAVVSAMAFTLAVAVGSVLTSLSPLLVAAFAVTTALNTLAAGVVGLIAGFMVTVNLVLATAAALSVLLSPLGILAVTVLSVVGAFATLGLFMFGLLGAVGAVTAGLLILGKNTKSFEAFKKGVENAVQPFFDALEPVYARLQSILPVIEALARGFGSIVSHLLGNDEAFRMFFDAVRTAGIFVLQLARFIGVAIPHIANFGATIVGVGAEVVGFAETVRNVALLLARVFIAPAEILRRSAADIGTMMAAGMQNILNVMSESIGGPELFSGAEDRLDNALSRLNDGAFLDEWAESMNAQFENLDSTPMADAMRRFADSLRMDEFDTSVIDNLIDSLRNLEYQTGLAGMSAEEMNEALTNVPDTFKVTQARFDAATAEAGFVPKAVNDALGGSFFNDDGTLLNDTRNNSGVADNQGSITQFIMENVALAVSDLTDFSNQLMETVGNEELRNGGVVNDGTSN